MGVIEIPGNVTHIADGAFGESNVTIKNLPEGLKTIGKKAFDGCTSLTEDGIFSSPEVKAKILHKTYRYVLI